MQLPYLYISSQQLDIIKEHFFKQTEMQRQFDHKSVDFTLEKIIEFGFDQYAETIGDISGAATKELAIEQVRNLVLSNISLLPTVKNGSHFFL